MEEPAVRISLWHPAFAGAVFSLLALAACEADHKTPPPKEYTLATPYSSVRTFAIAPAVNQSGSRDFDPLAVSDKVFEEMQQVRGLSVLPVNKTLAAMQRLGMRAIDSPQSACRLADVLGADFLLVPAVTAYDPYNPPTVGMTMALYSSTTRFASTPSATEPIARSITGATLPGTAEPATASASASAQPVAQVSAIFNSHNQSVLEELAEFAKGRTNYESALQSHQFLADSDAYMRFVCHAMARRMIEVERARVNGR